MTLLGLFLTFSFDLVVTKQFSFLYTSSEGIPTFIYTSVQFRAILDSIAEEEKDLILEPRLKF